MDANFKDLLAKYTTLTHKKSVFKELIRYLYRYTSTDIGPPTEQMVADAGAYSEVQEEVVQEVISDLQSIVLMLEMDLQEFTNQRLVAQAKRTPKKVPKEKGVVKRAKKVKKV